MNTKQHVEYYRALDQIPRHYNRAGFVVRTIHCDGEFRGMMEKVDDLDVDMNFTNAQDHVPKAERNNRTIKERIRAAYHRLPYKAIPLIMINYLAMIQGKQTQSIPREGRGLQILQPLHDIEPDKPGLHKTLCCAIWSLRTGQPRVNENELKCYKNIGRNLPAPGTKPTRRSQTHVPQQRSIDLKEHCPRDTSVSSSKLSKTWHSINKVSKA
jgi:hypothetical protein